MQIKPFIFSFTGLGTGAPIFESPYGDSVTPEEAPESISRAVASLPPEQMFELMKQMKVPWFIASFVFSFLFELHLKIFLTLFKAVMLHNHLLHTVLSLQATAKSCMSKMHEVFSKFSVMYRYITGSFYKEKVLLFVKVFIYMSLLK